MPLVASTLEAGGRPARLAAGSTRALSSSRTETKAVPAARQALAGAELGSWRRPRAKSRSRPMTSPVERISGPSKVSTPGKRAKGKTASLTAMWLSLRGSGMAAIGGEGVFQRLAGHDAGGDLGDRRADGLGDEGHGARGARVDLEHIDRAVLDRVLHVHQAADIERAGPAAVVWRSSSSTSFGRQRVDRQRAGRVARMDAGLLDVLHDAGDEGIRCRRSRQSTSTSMAFGR